MKRKYFGEQYVFAFIWNKADADGLWDGDASTVAAEFNVGEDEAYDALGELCDRNLIQRVGNSTYIVTKWPERDEAGDKELMW